VIHGADPSLTLYDKLVMVDGFGEVLDEVGVLLDALNIPSGDLDAAAAAVDAAWDSPEMDGAASAGSHSSRDAVYGAYRLVR
jgi:hypothetical protein